MPQNERLLLLKKMTTKILSSMKSPNNVAGKISNEVGVLLLALLLKEVRALVLPL